MNDTNVYTSKLTFLWLLNISKTLLVNSIWPWVWKLKAPEKIHMMLWQIVHNSLLMNLFRGRRNIVNSPICGYCNQEEETTSYCLRDYFFARDMLTKLDLVNAHGFLKL